MITITATLLLLAPPSITVRVAGEGYLRFGLEGRIVYAKSARLDFVEGRVVGPKGAALLPSMSVPMDAIRVEVDSTGAVSYVQASGSHRTGRITLAGFSEPSALTRHEPYLIAQTRPKIAFPGENGLGTLEAEGTVRVAAEPPAANSTQNPTPAAKQGSAGLRLTIHASVEVDANRLLLGGLAKIEGVDSQSLSSIDFGPMPPVGGVMRLARDRVIAKLKEAGFKPGEFDLTMPESVEVRRKGQHIEHAKFIEEAIRSAEAAFGNPGTWASRDAGPDFIGPMGAFELNTESIRPFPGGAVASVSVSVGGRRLNSRTVNLTTSLPLVEGAKAGAPIKVVFRVSGIAAEVDGKAKSSGYVGQTIEVLVSLNPGSPPTSHLGTIVAPGKVEVKL